MTFFNVSKNILFSFIVFLLFTQIGFSQEKGVFSGGFETNANIFLRDSSINAINTPQYDRQKFGGEAWLNLNYSIQGYTFGVRFDMFNNSNLRNPTGSYSGVGIGRWFVKKTFGRIDLQAGYLYDQIGSGLIFRSFETRPLFIDNALYGARVQYDLGKEWKIMGFAGVQKNAFDTYTGNLKGLRLEGFLSFGEEKPLTLAPGIGFVNRTLSDENMENVINALRTYLPEDRFNPLHNTYSTSIYNTLSYRGLTWYSEFAYKSDDIFFNPFAIKTEIVGSSIGKFEQKKGTVIYNSVSLALGGLGLTAEMKRTENFSFRIDPNLRLIRGLINYLVPLNRQNTYRLTARYSPAAQDISEMAYSFDARYKFSKSLSVLGNFSHVSDLDNNLLYREVFTEILYKYKRKWQLTTGIQFLNYNQEIYEQKSEVPLVETVVPYFDFLYKFSSKKALRTEFQYMSTQQDFGSWLFGLMEYSMAPNWVFEVSGMYNIDPKKKDARGIIAKTLYPTFGAVFNKDNNRFALRFVKQVEGVVCSGGICRLEPAFSGIRFNMNTIF
ncbi:MAG: hypothetical protein IPL63_04940 [Saprospiraceae bacterium]|nr:hypothetical protein [Saprospiraceae bacterium]MBK7525224.1 hypothetical protein [Saprospiraceae bacterium]MBK8370248.1 hypothetical protein [Saprospiraceae bacterium]MBK8546740.1 hypothetical protein [Saprospiraceae bacterium]MBK8817865.1 hypothetical protein [Saprospiraceae bacterium]